MLPVAAPAFAAESSLPRPSKRGVNLGSNRRAGKGVLGPCRVFSAGCEDLSQVTAPPDRCPRSANPRTMNLELSGFDSRKCLTSWVEITIKNRRYSRVLT